jgi:hypothetical protein
MPEHAISEMHFNALVENLSDAMQEMHRPVTTQNRFQASLAPMHSDIGARQNAAFSPLEAHYIEVKNTRERGL